MRKHAPPSVPSLHIVVGSQTEAEKRYYPAAVAPRATITAERVAAFPATPQADLKFRGGKLIPNLTFTNFYVGGSGAWQQSDITSIDHALAAAMSDRRLNNVMQQYFPTSITCTFRPSTILDGSPPSTVNQSDAEQMITNLYQGGKLQGYDLANTVFNLMLPSGTVLTDDTSGSGGSGGSGGETRGAGDRETKASSLQGLGGYHGEVSVSNATVYYAVGVYSETRSDGSQNGVVAFDQPWKNVVATFYHELNEARTDPDTNGTPGWISDPVSDLGGQSVEVGDYPVYEAGNNLSLVFQEIPLADGSGTVPVQFMYSNAVHGPEGPVDSPRALSDGGVTAMGGWGIGATVLSVLGMLAVGGAWLIVGLTSGDKALLLIGAIASGVVALIGGLLDLGDWSSGQAGSRIALIFAVLALIAAVVFIAISGVA